MQYRVMHNKTLSNRAVPDRRHTVKTPLSNPLGRLLLVYSLLLSGQVCAQSTEATRTLRQLTNERLMLTANNNSNDVSVRRSNGNGSFVVVANVATGTQPRAP